MRTLRAPRIWPLVLLTAGFSLLTLAPASAQSSAVVDIAEVRGPIDAPTYDYLVERLEAAASDDVQLLVIEIDSPGALDVDVAALERAIAASAVPVVVWVAPRGAELGGAARDIAAAADLLVAATDTDVDGADERASSLQDLLFLVDDRDFRGQTVDTWDDDAQVLDVSLRFQDMNLVDRTLHAVTSPAAALILLLIGIYGLIFEAYNPGIGLAAIIGVVSLALGLYGLDALGANWLGILILFAGIGALGYDTHVAGFGPATWAGLAAVGIGARLTFPPSGAIALGWIALAAIVIGTLIFFVSVMTAALRVRLRRPIAGDDAVIGTIGEAQTDIAPEGTVLTKGTVWRARTMETGIAAGSKVKVMASEGFVLLVEPLHGDAE